MLKALLWINGIGFVGLGLVGLALPGLVVDMIGYQVLRADAAIEVRAQYGGLFIGIGLFALWGAIRSAMWQASLGLMLFVYAGLALGRIVGLFVDGDLGTPGAYTLGATGFEVVMTIMFGVGLKHSNAVTSVD